MEKWTTDMTNFKSDENKLFGVFCEDKNGKRGSRPFMVYEWNIPAKCPVDCLFLPGKCVTAQSFTGVLELLPVLPGKTPIPTFYTGGSTKLYSQMT